MRVLLAHNYYGSSAPSGENHVFELERSLLIRNGHFVQSFVRHSDEIRGSGWVGMVRGAASTPWSFSAARAIRGAIEEVRPDVVHVHNTFPLLSPSIFSAVGQRAARVLTLHNYRLFCPSAIPVRAGKVCTLCLDERSVLPALRHGCYRGSRFATLPLAVSVALHRYRETWRRHVDAFVVLTEFQRDMVVAAGLPSERVFVKPNFYPGSPAVREWASRPQRVVYAGRLAEEKGVDALVDAWTSWGAAAPELRIVGDGPLRGALEAKARAGCSERIRFLGHVPQETAEKEIASARLVVLPSIWFEGFPMVLREALAFGTPAAVSDIGPLPGIVGRGRAGIVFAPRDPASLLSAVRSLWADEARLRMMSVGARQEYERKYAEDGNYVQLMTIYESAQAVQRTRHAS